jgi:hypothetical protein
VVSGKSVSFQSAALRATQAFHALSLFLISVAAFAAIGIALLCALGVMPWLTMTATFGPYAFPQAGMAVQLGLTVLLTLMLFFVPSSIRILNLERSHRDFRVSMQDVARAYHLAHTADRAGVFSLSSEFDQVRERIVMLRDHPDMALLESDVLTLAAQMGQQARHLAEVYSDAKVARAKDFLAQRQQEAEAQQARIIEALHVVREIRRWADQVEVEEAMVASQLAQLDEQLQAILPVLGYDFQSDALPEIAARPDNVVTLPQAKPAAE